MSHNSNDYAIRRKLEAELRVGYNSATFKKTHPRKAPKARKARGRVARKAGGEGDARLLATRATASVRKWLRGTGSRKKRGAQYPRATNVPRKRSKRTAMMYNNSKKRTRSWDDYGDDKRTRTERTKRSAPWEGGGDPRRPRLVRSKRAAPWDPPDAPVKRRRKDYNYP